MITSNETKKLLREYLQSENLTQIQFADMIGKSEVTLSRWLSPSRELPPNTRRSIIFAVEMCKRNGKPAAYAAIETRADIEAAILDFPDFTPGEKVKFIKFIKAL